MKIMKRDGSLVEFNSLKIAVAVNKAVAAVSENGKGELTSLKVNKIAGDIESYCKTQKKIFTVEDIQEMVETALMKEGAYETAKVYIRYRYMRNEHRNNQ